MPIDVKDDEPELPTPTGSLVSRAPTPPPGARSLVSPPPPVKAPPKLRRLDDHVETRKRIFDNVFKEVSELAPMENDRHILRLKDPEWVDPDRITIAQRKEALLKGHTLARRIRGKWELVDKATGDVLDSRHQVIARVPYLGDYGTYVHNGNDYTLQNQQRLKGGSFAREKNNGEIETHVNILPGQGISHRYSIDPAKSLFKINIAQGSMPVYPLMKAMGATDKELSDAWGGDVYQANVLKSEHGVLNKLATKVLRKADLENTDDATRTAKTVAAFGKMKLDPFVTGRTLGQPHETVNKDSVLAITKKLLAISRGQAEVDDRDHLAYQTFFGPEDLFAERIRRDHGRMRQDLFRRMSIKGHLRDMPSSALTPQVEHALLGSGLGQALEEINLAEVLDKHSRITRMGEGGIPSIESIPDEARSVQPSHLGFMDAWRTPESFRAGVDLNLARGVRKGDDGTLYAPFIDPKTGNKVYKNPADLADATIGFPGALTARRNWGKKRVAVMAAGKISQAKKRDIDLVMPDFEDAFSPLSNLVPMKSGVKGQRIAMASRMLTQALPLEGAEAPLVRGEVPGKPGRSFEEEYAPHMAAVFSKGSGRVMDVQKDGIRVRYDDGHEETHELHDNVPLNRKTFVHNTPMVKPGDVVRPDQLLAKSNHTDEKGDMALGRNLRTGLWAWEGKNFEDAIVISQSAAEQKLKSEHAYKHDLAVDDKHQLGKDVYTSFFPATFDKKKLAELDRHGMVKPGAVVKEGDPLILAVRQKELTENKIHKKGQPGYADVSVLWSHHDPGVVTDVVRGRDGPVVVVKSLSPMRVGDKLSGRYGDKGIISHIVPDDQMPHDESGRPFEVLMNPHGTISRTNPAAIVEMALGKIAAKTGRPVVVKDFDEIEDLAGWAGQQLKAHGLKETEDLVDPRTGIKVPGIGTGNRFFMKLSHTAESKGQGRGSGGYSLDDTPAKGGETGCFVGDSILDTERGPVKIEDVVIEMMRLKVRTKTAQKNAEVTYEPVTDWFCYAVPEDQLIDVVLENGTTLTVTKRHGFVMMDGVQCTAEHLRAGDELME
jgi:DNA-directed RNA polymerase subunit beta